MTNTPIVELIGTVGFPIAITIWVLYTSRKDRNDKSEKLTEAINALGKLIEKLCVKLDS